MRTWLGAILAGSLVFLANLFGYWQATILAGALLVLFCSVRKAAVLAVVIGAAGWGAAIFILNNASAVMRLAELLGRMMGLGDGGTVIVLFLPMLIGSLLAVSGAYVAGSLERVLTGYLVTDLKAGDKVTARELQGRE